MGDRRGKEARQRQTGDGGKRIRNGSFHLSIHKVPQQPQSSQVGVEKADLGLLLGKIQQYALETPRTSLWHKAGILNRENAMREGKSH